MPSAPLQLLLGDNMLLIKLALDFANRKSNCEVGMGGVSNCASHTGGGSANPSPGWLLAHCGRLCPQPSSTASFEWNFRDQASGDSSAEERAARCATGPAVFTGFPGQTNYLFLDSPGCLCLMRTP